MIGLDKGSPPWKLGSVWQTMDKPGDNAVETRLAPRAVT